jgi:hypothetical protein
MWRSLLYWLTPLFVSCFCWLPAAYADAESDVPKPGYAFPYTLAFLALIIIMVIVCTPSRKR